MIELKPEDCEHESLVFSSGDYYVFCDACHASWMRKSWTKLEYGSDEDGKQCGGAPELANKGKGALLSGQHRYRVDAGLDCTHEQLRAHIDQTLKDPLLRAVVLAMLGLN